MENVESHGKEEGTSNGHWDHILDYNSGSCLNQWKLGWKEAGEQIQWYMLCKARESKQAIPWPGIALECPFPKNTSTPNAVYCDLLWGFS